MEKNDELKGKGNTYTTLFRQYDPRALRWFSLDPKPNASESRYTAMGCNPIINVDPLGDSISIGNIQSRDENGQLRFPGQLNAFEAFLSTSEGTWWLYARAQKGFKYEFQTRDEPPIEVEEDGYLSKAGIDYVINIRDVGDVIYEKQKIIYSGKGYTWAELYKDSKNTQHIKIEIFSDNYGGDGLLEETDTWIHETFYHGWLHEQAFATKGEKYPGRWMPYKDKLGGIYVSHDPQQYLNSLYGKYANGILMKIQWEYNIQPQLKEDEIERNIQWKGFEFTKKDFGF